MTRHHATSTPVDGTPGRVWTLAHDEVAVEVAELGARLLSLRCPDRAGAVADVVAGPSDPAAPVAGAWEFCGATVGRWANRLAGARVVVDGTTHDLVASEGPNLLHGGPEGFDTRTWAGTDASDERGPAVRLALTSPDGDQGFPGTLEAAVTYRLLAGGRLRLEHEATSDAPTVVNLTNHAYWNLAGPGGDAPATIADHTLRVRAARYVAVDGELLPTAVQEVDGTRFDLRDDVHLAGLLGRGMVDHCLLLDAGDDPAAVLTHPPSGRRLTVHTDQPGLQVYLGGKLEPPHQALALEPEVPPDAPNRPDLGLGAQDGVLRPGATYTHVTTFALDTV